MDENLARLRDDLGYIHYNIGQIDEELEMLRNAKKDLFKWFREDVETIRGNDKDEKDRSFSKFEYFSDIIDARIIYLSIRRVIITRDCAEIQYSLNMEETFDFLELKLDK